MTHSSGSLTRTDAILSAIRRELADRRGSIDGSENIAEIRISIWLKPGTTWIERTQYSEERIVRARMQRLG
jgi:hypothetical protein